MGMVGAWLAAAVVAVSCGADADETEEEVACPDGSCCTWRDFSAVANLCGAGECTFPAVAACIDIDCPAAVSSVATEGVIST